jgi:lipid-A-disaccharide synthase-like uncharacterized protein
MKEVISNIFWVVSLMVAGVCIIGGLFLSMQTSDVYLLCCALFLFVVLAVLYLSSQIDSISRRIK